MSEYPAGTVAVATVRGVKGVRIFRYTDVYGHPRWDCGEPVEGQVVYPDASIADIRPLVVLDPEDSAQVDAVCKALVVAMHAAGDRASAANGVHPATIRIALDSLTKPPRIQEPGQFAIVKASCSCDSERVTWASLSCMWVDRGGDRHGWDDLIDPTLVREGIES